MTRTQSGGPSRHVPLVGTNFWHPPPASAPPEGRLRHLLAMASRFSDESVRVTASEPYLSFATSGCICCSNLLTTWLARRWRYHGTAANPILGPSLPSRDAEPLMSSRRRQEPRLMTWPVRGVRTYCFTTRLLFK